MSKEAWNKATRLRYELFRFSYFEFLNFASKKEGADPFGEYLLKGGFPEYLKYGRSDILPFNDIVMRDIVVRHKLRSRKP